MKAVFVGASGITVMTARLLLERGHEVVIIERDRDVIDALYDEIDCGFICGDGSKPEVLKETSPAEVDVLFCLTDSDKANIIASLVGRSLGFPRVVTSIGDVEFEPICAELGLDNVIVPSRTISRYLADTLHDGQVLELSTYIRGEARFFMFQAGEVEDGHTAIELDLPAESRIVCLYRGNELVVAHRDTKVRSGDEVVVLTHSRHLDELRERWVPATAAAIEGT